MRYLSWIQSFRRGQCKEYMFLERWTSLVPLPHLLLFFELQRGKLPREHVDWVCPCLFQVTQRLSRGLLVRSREWASTTRKKRDGWLSPSDGRNVTQIGHWCQYFRTQEDHVNGLCYEVKDPRPQLEQHPGIWIYKQIPPSRCKPINLIITVNQKCSKLIGDFFKTHGLFIIKR